MHIKYVLILLFVIIGITAGQAEFLVNTHPDTTQRDPQIACDNSGNFVVVWHSVAQLSDSSRGDIFMRAFTSDDQPVGDEVQVNTFTGGDQEKPALAMRANGDFIVVWTSFSDFTSLYDIKARIYKNGTASGDEFLVNTTTLHSQTNPDIAVDSNGNFIVVWDSWYQDGSDKGVYGQRFDPQGNKLGAEFRINTTTDYSQQQPVVKTFADGRFIVAWESWNQDVAVPSGYGLYGQLFDDNGNKTGTEFRINTFTNDYQWFGDLATLDDGGFAAVWCSWQQDGYDGGIYFQRFESDGSKTGPEVPVNKTKVYYQWLPKIIQLKNSNFAVIWSSWKQDGSREGIYARLLRPDGRPLSLETQLNDYTDSFQWEPDIIAGDGNSVVAVWASWGQFQNDYEVIAKRCSFKLPVGNIKTGTYGHEGRTTSRIFVHVMDSTRLTGDRYKVSFKIPRKDSVVTTIEDIVSQETKINDFTIDRGENFFYLTPEFDGIAVEFVPEFDFELDTEHSLFINNSGSNLLFETTLPSAGIPHLAPIDLILIWGNSDTLSDGSYAQPSDTAMGISGAKDIAAPFYAWNTTDNQKIDLLVIEQGSSMNQRWDAGERIIFLTPEPYKNGSSDTHAQLNSIISEQPLILPTSGDTSIVRTTRPFKSEDVFYFETTKQNMTGLGLTQNHYPEKFRLYQNYPNPFNPSTTIKYQISRQTRVSLDIFNLLGQKIDTLVNQKQQAGVYKYLFDGSTLASGLYFYALKTDNQRICKKMLLVK